MRAAENKHYGTPQVLRVTQRDRPTPKPRQVLIEVVASVVTQGDRRLRAADFGAGMAMVGRLMFGVFAPRHPTGGTMLAGRVVAVGDKVTRFSVGDDVFASIMRGAWADYVAVHEDAPIARMPTNLRYQEAAALPYGGMTALAFLRDIAKVRPGERVLVLGAAGGVGRMAVQIAKYLGAEVTAVCGGGADTVWELGADTVIDYRRESFTERGESWDVIFDTVEGNHFREYRRALTSKGRYLSLYMTGRLVAQSLMTRFTDGQRALTGAIMGSAEQMQDLAAAAEAGRIRPVIAARFPLERVAEAHVHLEAERPYGDVVIEVQPGVPPAPRECRVQAS